MLCMSDKKLSIEDLNLNVGKKGFESFIEAASWNMKNISCKIYVWDKVKFHKNCLLEFIDKRKLKIAVSHQESEEDSSNLVSPSKTAKLILKILMRKICVLFVIKKY